MQNTKIQVSLFLLFLHVLIQKIYFIDLLFSTIAHIHMVIIWEVIIIVLLYKRRQIYMVNKMKQLDLRFAPNITKLCYFSKFLNSSLVSIYYLLYLFIEFLLSECNSKSNKKNFNSNQKMRKFVIFSYELNT